MLKALEEHMPEGGFFIWVTLPEHMNTHPLLQRAIQAGVVLVPGAGFTTAERSHSLRLAFSAVSSAEIREGVRRLAGILDEALSKH